MVPFDQIGYNAIVDLGTANVHVPHAILSGWTGGEGIVEFDGLRTGGPGVNRDLGEVGDNVLAGKIPPVQRFDDVIESSHGPVIPSTTPG